MSCHFAEELADPSKREERIADRRRVRARRRAVSDEEEIGPGGAPPEDHGGIFDPVADTTGEGTLGRL